MQNELHRHAAFLISVCYRLSHVLTSTRFVWNAIAMRLCFNDLVTTSLCGMSFARLQA
ncbi:MAG: hypothetical protein QM666_02045 [Acinetobacter sp.]